MSSLNQNHTKKISNNEAEVGLQKHKTANLSPRVSPDRRRAGSGLTMLKSINSTQNSYIVGSGQTDARSSTVGVPNVVNEAHDLMSENEAENLAAQPMHTQTSSSSSSDNEEENEQGLLIVPVIEQPAQDLDQDVIRQQSEEEGEEEAVTPVQTVKDPSPVKQKESQPNSPMKRMELGGILVYDAYARITGSIKLTKYYSQNPPPKIDPYIIFTKQQVAQATADHFSKEARERDFANDLDKQFYQRMPRFDMKNKELKAPQYQISVPTLHNMLIFDSRFESGNLRKAAKVNNIEYNLWLENDLNTRGHTQWFFFKVVFQSDKPARINLNILNLAKTFSLFKVGMKPVVFSLKKFQQRYPEKCHENFNPLEHKDGWQRACDNIKYGPNDIARFNIDQAKFAHNLHNDKFLQNNNGCGEGTDNYYTLSFDYKFEHPGDEVWFAHAVPYTYTDMQNSVKAHLDEKQNAGFLRAEILCNTLCGMPVPLLTITDNIKTYMTYTEQVSLQSEVQPFVRKQFKQKYQEARKLLKQAEETNKPKVQQQLTQTFEEVLTGWSETNMQSLLATKILQPDFGQRLIAYTKDHSQKRCIVLTSRVHPGEPQASFMLEGTIQMLLSDTPLAHELRKHFVFKVVPMLNPDGVIYGNYRCSLLGCDLNRKWLMPNKFLHPTIYYSKQLIRYVHWERKVILYCDMHGHSRKQNVFFYGCSYKNYEQEGRIKNAQTRILPLLCCHKNTCFSFAGSSFKIEKTKESCGRVVVFREFNIMNSFTLECSFHGKTSGPNGQIQHMSLQEMRDIGSCLVQQLENYLPHEQYKLNIIGSKVLDIFYDEFVKFVPAYILKREKEEQQENPLQIQLPQQQFQVKIKKQNIRKLPSKTLVTQVNIAVGSQAPVVPAHFKTKSSGNKHREKGSGESPSEHPSDFESNQAEKPFQPPDLSEFVDLELFINHQYKRGVDNDVDDSSSDEADINNKYLMPKRDSKLPYIRHGKVRHHKTKINDKTQSDNVQGGRKAPQIIQLNQIVPQQVMSMTQQIPHNHKIMNRGDKDLVRMDAKAHSSQSHNPGNDTGVVGQGNKGSSTRIHPQMKGSITDDHAAQIVEYVVDGKRIRVQRDSKPVMSPQYQNSNHQREDTDSTFGQQAVGKSYQTDGQSQRNNKLGVHGILKRLPATDNQTQPKPTVSDFRGVKSFTEYAERLSHQKQSSQDHTQSSFFNDNSPIKHQQFQTYSKKQSIIMSHEQNSPNFQPSDFESEINPVKRRSNQTQYMPQSHTDQLVKSKAIQLMTQNQQNPQYQLQQMQQVRKTGLEVLTNHIKSGGGNVINEQVIEAHRKLTQLDRESIMGVGFQIKMRPQAKTEQPQNPVLSVKSTQSQKKQTINPNIAAISAQGVSQYNASAQAKLNSSRSQDPQQQQLVDQQVRFSSTGKHFGSPVVMMNNQHQQFGPNGKPLTSLVCPIKTKMQSSALRTHLKHKRNVQVPLPLHQQERIAAQEQNQLYPASMGATQDYMPPPQKIKDSQVNSPRIYKKNKNTTEQSLPTSGREGGPVMYVPKDKGTSLQMHLTESIHNPVSVNLMALTAKEREGRQSREPTPGDSRTSQGPNNVRNRINALPVRNAMIP